MDICTQLGGAYRPDNHALFTVKKLLTQADIEVRQPIYDDFIVHDNQSYCFDPTLTTLKDIHLDLLKSIATCDVHIVCNESHDTPGYIGNHTADGIMYALLKNKPIILLHPPIYSPKLSKQIVEVLNNNQHQFIIFNLQKMPAPNIAQVITDIVRAHQTYNLNQKSTDFLQAHAQKLINQAI